MINESIPDIYSDIIHTDSPLKDSTYSPPTEISDASNSCNVYRFTFSVLILGTVCILGLIGNGLALIVMYGFYDNNSR